MLVSSWLPLSRMSPLLLPLLLHLMSNLMHVALPLLPLTTPLLPPRVTMLASPYGAARTVSISSMEWLLLCGTVPPICSAILLPLLRI